MIDNIVMVEVDMVCPASIAESNIICLDDGIMNIGRRLVSSIPDSCHE